MSPSYHTPKGGLPGQTQLLTDRAVFTEAYAVIPGRSLSDIVASRFPGWEGTRGWILARPMSGFAESFAQTIMELAPGGGSDTPEPDPRAEAALFVTAGRVELALDGTTHMLEPGSHAYIPPGMAWSIRNRGAEPAGFHWIRKLYEPVPGMAPPPSQVARDQDTPPDPMPDTGGCWATTRFVDPADLRHDMAVTIVTFQPGGTIPFMETHVMEHGLYVLEGKAAYKLNRDWVEVEAGDFMWLRAFCPQACIAAGPGPFRYLLYKNVNRHPPLGPVVADGS